MDREIPRREILPDVRSNADPQLDLDPGVYMGITHRSVIERFNEHITQEKDYRRGLRSLNGDGSKLHDRMASLGITSSCI